MSTETDRELLERLENAFILGRRCFNRCSWDGWPMLRELARKGIEAEEFDAQCEADLAPKMGLLESELSPVVRSAMRKFKMAMRIRDLESQLATAQARIAELEAGIVCALCGSPAYWDDDPNQQVWRHTGCRSGSTDLIICDRYGYPIPVRPAIEAARQKE